MSKSASSGFEQALIVADRFREIAFFRQLPRLIERVTAGAGRFVGVREQRERAYENDTQKNNSFVHDAAFAGLTSRGVDQRTGFAFGVHNSRGNASTLHSEVNIQKAMG